MTYIKNRKIKNWCFYRRRKLLTGNLTWAEKHRSAMLFKMPSTPQITSLPKRSSHFNSASKNKPKKVKIWKTWSINKLPVTPLRRSWVPCWTAGYTWASSVPGQQWKLIASWAVSREAWPVDWGKQPSPYTESSLQPIWDMQSSLGLPEEMLMNVHEYRRLAPSNIVRGWSTFPVRRARKSWACSAWRRGSFESI